MLGFMKVPAKFYAPKICETVIEAVGTIATKSVGSTKSGSPALIRFIHLAFIEHIQYRLTTRVEAFIADVS